MRAAARGAAEAAPALVQRQEIGGRLARMLLVGQRVDHVQARRRLGELDDAVLAEGADHGARHPAFEVAGDVGDGLARAERAFLRRDDHVAAELVHGDLERRARPQRRLVEQQRDVLAGQRLRRRRAASQLALALQARRQLQQVREAGGVEVEHRQVVLGDAEAAARRPPRRAWRGRGTGRTVEDRAEVFTAIVSSFPPGSTCGTRR